MHLTQEQAQRYSRQIMLREIGETGQHNLACAKVLIVGAGGLGSPAAMYLAAAGIGRIGIADPDVVDLSNLQRQILHTTNDIGKAKVDSAKSTMQSINPDVEIKTYHEKIDSDTIRDILSDYDFVLDATDNFASKYLINDACVLADKPFTYAGLLRFEGQLMTVLPHRTPCYRCVFPTQPPRSAKTGVVGATAGVIGSLQALEAIKYITGAGELMTGRLLIFDALTAEFHTLKLPARGDGCAVCSDHPTISVYNDSEPI